LAGGLGFRLAESESAATTPHIITNHCFYWVFIIVSYARLYVIPSILGTPWVHEKYA